MRETGLKQSEKDLELQEIYNRYFFFRAEEIERQNADVPRLIKEKQMRLKMTPRVLAQHETRRPADHGQPQMIGGDLWR